jgi:hypothetical protein
VIPPEALIGNKLRCIAGVATSGSGPRIVLFETAPNVLVADFDKSTWKTESLAYVSACKAAGIPAYIEISRSGEGARMDVFQRCCARKAGTQFGLFANHKSYGG